MRQITRPSNEKHNFDSFQLQSLKASFSLLDIKKFGISQVLTNLLYGFITFFLIPQERCGDSSTAESGSDFNDYSSPTRQRSYNYPRLAPVREEVSFKISSYLL